MITNTTKEVNRNPMLGLMTALPGGIEAQEARGQRLVQSDVLPVKIGKREAYEALGFTFGNEVEGDPIFQEATLPAGWKRKSSDHAMWSYIVDERGLKRAAIFYKAAFYDRSAHMHLCNVGRELATDFIWGDEKDPKIPANLTAQEIEEAKTACIDSGFRDRKPRADAFLNALKY